MANEIKRNNWSRFCKRFTTTNRYRCTRLDMNRGKEQLTSFDPAPFMGIRISKKGRFIDGIQFFTGGWDADSVMQPVVTVTDPAAIWLEKGDDGRDNRLRVTSKDGVMVCLDLEGDKEPTVARHLVERVAYSMYERRGYAHGNDMHDWLEAENKIKEVESQLTS
jgi:hypothetical protein